MRRGNKTFCGENERVERYTNTTSFTKILINLLEFTYLKKTNLTEGPLKYRLKKTTMRSNYYNVIASNSYRQVFFF